MKVDDLLWLLLKGTATRRRRRRRGVLMISVQVGRDPVAIEAIAYDSQNF